MDNEKIRVLLENGKRLDVVVATKKVDAIWIILGEGPHSSKCKLIPTDNGLAYAGTILGREILYERTVQQIEVEIQKQYEQAMYQPQKPARRRRGR